MLDLVSYLSIWFRCPLLRRYPTGQRKPMKRSSPRLPSLRPRHPRHPLLHRVEEAPCPESFPRSLGNLRSCCWPLSYRCFVGPLSLCSSLISESEHRDTTFLQINQTLL